MVLRRWPLQPSIGDDRQGPGVSGTTACEAAPVARSFMGSADGGGTFSTSGEPMTTWRRSPTLSYPDRHDHLYEANDAQARASRRTFGSSSTACTTSSSGFLPMRVSPSPTRQGSRSTAFPSRRLRWMGRFARSDGAHRQGEDPHRRWRGPVPGQKLAEFVDTGAEQARRPSVGRLAIRCSLGWQRCIFPASGDIDPDPRNEDATTVDTFCFDPVIPDVFRAS